MNLRTNQVFRSNQRGAYYRTWQITRYLLRISKPTYILSQSMTSWTTWLSIVADRGAIAHHRGVYSWEKACVYMYTPIIYKTGKRWHNSHVRPFIAPLSLLVQRTVVGCDLRINASFVHSKAVRLSITYIREPGMQVSFRTISNFLC